MNTVPEDVEVKLRDTLEDAFNFVRDATPEDIKLDMLQVCSLVAVYMLAHQGLDAAFVLAPATTNEHDRKAATMLNGILISQAVRYIIRDTMKGLDSEKGD